MKSKEKANNWFWRSVSVCVVFNGTAGLWKHLTLELEWRKTMM